MEIPDRLAVVHQPTRLRIIALLARQRDVGFAPARDALGLTDGNLAAHARRLEEAGLLASRRALTRDGFEVRYRITPEGDAAFSEYLAILRAFLDAQAEGAGASQRAGPA